MTRETVDQAWRDVRERNLDPSSIALMDLDSRVRAFEDWAKRAREKAKELKKQIDEFEESIRRKT